MTDGRPKIIDLGRFTGMTKNGTIKAAVERSTQELAQEVYVYCFFIIGLKTS